MNKGQNNACQKNRVVQEAKRSVQKAFRTEPCKWCSRTFQGLYMHLLFS